MHSSITLDRPKCEQSAASLSKLLADTYVVYTKTQNCHWNIIDPRFFSLHKMLEDQYAALAEMIDEIAERIRMLRIKSPGSMHQFLELTSLNEGTPDMPANDMLHSLLNDHEAVANYLRPEIRELQKHGDEGSADLMIQHLRYHEKTAWMLRSHFMNQEE